MVTAPFPSTTTVSTAVIGVKLAVMVLLPFIVTVIGLLVEATLPVQPVNSWPGRATAVSVTVALGRKFCWLGGVCVTTPMPAVLTVRW